jgi:hypothetical protein
MELLNYLKGINILLITPISALAKSFIFFTNPALEIPGSRNNSEEILIKALK